MRDQYFFQACFVFQLEDGYDFFTIYHSNGTNQEMTGFLSPGSMIFPDGQISLRFQTDSSGEATGFKLSFKTGIIGT